MVLPFAVGCRTGDGPLLHAYVAGPYSERRHVGGQWLAAMRAAIVGFFHDQPEARLEFGRALAQVTHRDDRAVEGALFVAELAACLVNVPSSGSWERTVVLARRVVTNSKLDSALERAVQLASEGVSTECAARMCGTTGFVLHTVPFATFCLLRYGGVPAALAEAISAAGAIPTRSRRFWGAGSGALHGVHGLPVSLIARIHDGPFGPSHLIALASCLSKLRDKVDCPIPAIPRPGQWSGT